MKNLILIFIMIFSYSAKAKKWKIGNNLVEMIINKKQRVHISSNCFRDKNICMAFKAFEKSKFLEVKKTDMKNGKILGSSRCTSLGGKSLTASHLKRRVDFCLFSDGSAIESMDLGR